jgi:hypothetical protein
MSAYLALNTAVVKDRRTEADLAAEHAAASARINAVHPFYHGKVEPREPSQDERDAVQARIDSYKQHSFLAAEAAEHDHWSY